MASGKIESSRHVTGIATRGSGITDHNRLSNRDLTDQHPISAITGLQDELDSKLDSKTASPLIEEAVKNKAKGLWYDAAKIKAKKSYWYLTSELDKETGLGDPNYIISGPYDLGQGGGSGGGVTTITLVQEDWPAVVVVGATTTITVWWDSVIGDDKQSTGNGTLYLTVNNTQVEVKANCTQGLVSFDISKYLVAGNNTIQVKVLDLYGTSKTTVGVISTVTLELESTFNYKLTYPVEHTTGINYTYTPYGNIEKTVYFIIDGLEYGTQVVKSTGEQQTFHIEALTHGSHTLEVYFTAIINDNVVKSQSLYYDLIYHTAGNTTPIIASEFRNFEQEQYISFNIPYRVYIENKNEFEVDLLVNNELYKHVIVGSGEQTWNYKSDTTGNYILSIKCGSTKKDFQVHINASQIDIQPVTQNLALALTTAGRSNTEPAEQRVIWKDAEHKILCTLSNFNWSSDGWLLDSEGNTVLRVTGDARVEIPYEPFLNDFRSSGKTIEFEIATSTISDYSSKIISCFDDSRGFYITPQIALFKSQQSELSTQYKEDDHVRLTFVIEKNTDNRIIWMYINGIASGACQYPLDDSFRQLSPKTIIIGSNNATVDIYNIRVYDNNLTSRQVVNNWIADTQSSSLKTERYYRNDNYNDKDELVISKLPSDLPYIIWDINPLPQYKGDKRLGNVTYAEPLDSSRDFASENATYNVQGTSSSVYPVKNIRIKFKQNKDYPQSIFSWTDNNGDTIKKFGITKDGIKDNYFTFKVDYASSEGANNVELVRLYNDASKANNILTPPQKLDSKVRVGIDGYPIISFHKDEEGTVLFNSKANFNNDKANEDVYGFTGDWSEDGSVWDGDESWEITNNTSDLAKFKVPITADNFDAAFEIRFPDEDGYNKMDKLGPMSAWVASTYRANATNNKLEAPTTFTYQITVRSEDGSYSTTTKSETFDTDTERYRLIKFKAELKDWFDVNSTIFYYIFTHLYLMIDSRAKNAFPTYFKSRVAGDGGDRWFWLPYDMDTAIGIDNKGKLSFDYNLEDTDHLDGADVFNGQDSVLWNNLRDAFEGEIGEMYSKLRTQGYISYSTTEKYFETHQAKWSENIFNEDSKVKYITPLKSGDNYLEMLQGSKAEQRKWWLYNRFKYMDSKYTAGDAKSDFIQFRAYVEAGKEKPSITVTPYADIYATVSYANGAAGTKQKRATRNVPIVIENPFTKEEAETDQETYIYSASQLKSIGDISGFKPDTVKVGNAVKLQELKVGSAEEGYTNPHLTELTLGSNILLKLLDVRNCINLTQAIDVSQCTNIEEIYFEGTKITGINLPDGGILKHLHLPATLTKLTLKNQPLLTDLILEGTENIESLWLENIPSSSIDSYKIITVMKDKSAVRLLGINETYKSSAQIKAFYDRLDTMKGLDSAGQVVDKAQVQGKIYINEISYADYISYLSRYPEVTIVATQIICNVSFYTQALKDGSLTEYEWVLFKSQAIVQGTNAKDPGIPTKTAVQQYYYTFNSWDKSYLNIQTDLDIYAVFDQHLQVYRVTFDPKSSVILVDPSYEDIEYGSLAKAPSLSGIPEQVVFKGWYYPDGAKFSFNTPITDTLDLSAQWQDESAPVISLTRLAYNKFSYHVTDNVGVTGWQVTTTEEEPIEWHEVGGVAELNGEYIINSAGIYYFWAKDAQHTSTHEQICAWPISCFLGTGVSSVTLSENEEVLTNFALHGSLVKVSAILDNHYENLVLKDNSLIINNDTTIEVKEAHEISASCSPKVFTVKFNNMNRGKSVEDQMVVYLHTVTEPDPQFDSGHILEGWYREESLTTKWTFGTDVVDDNMTLFAKWSIYHEPSRLTIEVPSDNYGIIFNYSQDSPEGCSVDFGDGSDAEVYPTAGKVQLVHTYTTAGRYIIRITSKTGLYYLGNNFENQVIMPITILTDVVFAWDVPYTNYYAFKGATGLTNINLTQYMSSVNVGTFQDCTNITTLDLPNNIQTLGYSAFQGCTGLTGELILPPKLTSIDGQCFQGCTGITKITMPDSVTKISYQTFQDCSALNTIILSNNLTTINPNLFYNCSSLTRLDIPASVQEIRYNAFRNCTSLEKLIFRNPDIIFDSDGNGGIYHNCPKLKTVGPIGGGYNIEYAFISKIPDRAFWGDGSIYSCISSIVLPDTIVSIGSYALAGQAFETIALPPALKTIGNSAFSSNSRLTTLKIPSSVEYIGNKVVADVMTLNSLYLRAVGINQECKVLVPDNAWARLCSSNLVIHVMDGLTEQQCIDYYGEYWAYRNNTEVHKVQADISD